MAYSPDLSCTKGFSIPQNILLTYQMWELPEERLGIGQWAVTCLCWVLSISLLFITIYFTIYYFYYDYYFISIIKLILYQPVSLFCFSCSPPYSTGGWRGKWESDCRECHCWLGLNHDSPFWPQCGGQRVDNNARSDQSMLEQICCNHSLCRFSSSCHNVDLFAIRTVLVLRVKTYCVCSLWWCLSSMGPQLRVIILFFVVEKQWCEGFIIW